jgi:hypothetical protein
VKVNAHRLGIVDFECHVKKPVGVRSNFRRGKKLHALTVVDFDPHEIAAFRARDGKRRRITEEAFVKGARLGHVADIKSRVRNAQDARPLRRFNGLAVRHNFLRESTGETGAAKRRRKKKGTKFHG